MIILVPVKPVFDPYMRIRIKLDGTGIENQNAKIVMNPFDEIAVEEAIRIKEASNGVHTVKLVSIGGSSCTEILRMGLALGADGAIHISCEQVLNSLVTAKILKELVLKESADLVMMGKQAVDNDNNQTGQMLAALLDWPQATFASKVTLQSNTVQVMREVDTGSETLELDLPAVVTTDLRLNTPRYASLPNLMKARQKPLTTIPVTSLNMDLSSPCQILQVRAPDARKPGRKVSSVQELMDNLKNVEQVL